MEKNERVRLLLVGGDERPVNKGRGTRISHGAASLVSRWPGYIISAIWCLISVISIISLLLLLLYMVLVKEERKYFPVGTLKPFNDKASNRTSFRLNNKFCKEKSNATLPSEIDRNTPNIELLNAANNVFYVRTKPLSKHSACAIESMLKYGKNKTIFILMFDKYELNYENNLKENYRNLILSNVNVEKYLKRTPFNWKHDDKNKTMVAAGLMTIWQFGGTVLSDNLVLFKPINDINKYDKIKGSCMVDYELLSCSEQCSAFTYEFIQQLVKYNMSLGSAPIIDRSLLKFCNNTKECDGARRAKNVCNDPKLDSFCEFVRLDMWLEIDPSWRRISKHCPLTDRYSKSLANNTKLEESKKTTTKVPVVRSTKKRLTTQNHFMYEKRHR